MLGLRKYGGVARFNSRTTVISSPTLVDELLRDPSASYEVSQNFLGHKLTATEVASIMQVRPLLNPSMRPTALLDVPSHIAVLVERSLKPGHEQVSIDPLPFCERVIPQALAWHLFGTGRDPFGEQVADLLDLLENVIGNVLAAPAAWRSPMQRQIETRYRRLQQAMVAYLTRRAARIAMDPTAAEGCVVDDLVSGGGGADTAELAHLLIGAMLAAQRVPAAGAGWLMMMMADHPDHQADLLDEATEFAELLRVAAPMSIAQFPLTLASVLESLRLYPPTWLITRVATRDVHLGGYRFARGHMFMLSPYVLHRDHSVYSDAESFVPQRWLDGAPSPGTYLPFGRGSHRCPGSDMATTSLVALALSILARYEIRRSGVVRPDPRNTLKPSGLRINLRERSPRAAQSHA